ncbi:hypothetical protein SAMN02745172_00729 [Pseudoxanthobacter soli DSM 19599]|uniref:Uncharacterized protein n=1 Tax=Pseudoxanthobacter soli DSM 19599 TaxID=1123029 RepID=A0A1M7Z8T4_9HYPH|nr:hypothetical protein [Pseudoxanthobacter soli]SHO61328.1 hypothetical protein SAMN02745172_00729 [Pseudoxanthobacter soli DSM 19599]
MRSWLTFGNLALLVLAVVLGIALYWVIYVFLAASPYEAAGIGINSRLPEPVRRFSCRILNERHPHMWPPLGCEKFWGDAPPPPALPPQ